MNKTDLRKGMTAKQTLLCSESFRESMYYSLSKIFIFADKFEKQEVNNN